MAESSITVSGGAGGIGAQLDDMRTESAQLSAMAAQLVEQATAAAGIAGDGDLLASAVLSPLTAAVAGQQIVFATGQMLLYATEAGVSALFLTGAADAYEAVDRGLALAADAVVNTGTFVLGASALPVALLAGAVAVGAARVAAAHVAFVYIGGYAAEVVESIGEGVVKTVEDPWKLAIPGFLLSSLVINTVESYDGAEAQASVDAVLAAQLAQLAALAQLTLLGSFDQLNELAGENAWAVDLIAQGAPGLLYGLSLPLLILLGPAEAQRLSIKYTGGPWPPTSYESALEAIIGGGNRAGILNDGPLLTRDNLFVPPPVKGEDVVEPSNLSTLFEGSAQIDAHDFIGDDKNSFARIRITEVPGTPPSFIVQVPSTQEWNPVAGSTPNDVTGDTHAMLARQTALSSAVDAAMQEAGITSQNPVMLQGFSLGGITAGQMAADPSLNYNITHVVTGGAPIANFDIPGDVQVLSFEFNEDPVAQLDGHDNPDAAHWTTVQADAPLLEGETAAPGIIGAHHAGRYAHTAAEVDASTDPSVTAWTESTGNFFTSAPTTTTDYGAQR